MPLLGGHIGITSWATRGGAARNAVSSAGWARRRFFDGRSWFETFGTSNALSSFENVTEDFCNDVAMKTVPSQELGFRSGKQERT
jgi:hypothetical protein